MIVEDINNLTDAERNAILVGDDLQELKTHGVLEFPLSVNSITLSNTYIELIRWHWHQEVELVYILEGKVEALVDEESFILSAGQGIFINQNVLHAFRRVENHDAVFFSIVFHPAIVFGYGRAALAVIKYISPISENPNVKHFLLNKENTCTATILELMLKIRNDYISEQFGYELTCKAYICLLWNELLKLPREDAIINIKPKRITQDEQRVKAAITYMEQHFTEPITLDDIAQSVHLSKSECCRCFQRMLHQTPFECLLKYRIFYATRLIQQQDPNAENISNLAITVGFSNISYFNKVFKRYLNMTPTEYKKEHSKTDS